MRRKVFQWSKFNLSVNWVNWGLVKKDRVRNEGKRKALTFEVTNGFTQNSNSDPRSACHFLKKGEAYCCGTTDSTFTCTFTNKWMSC